MYFSAKVVYVLVSYSFLLSSCFASELAEEGWRYHGVLTAKLRFEARERSVNFQPEHFSMASIIKDNSDDGQYSSLLRFTPVFLNETDFAIGNSVILKPLEDIEFSSLCYEVACASGIYSRSTQEWITKCRTPIHLTSNGSLKRDIMTLRSANHVVGSGKDKEYHPNRYPVRFMQTNYVDRGLLERQIDFRYRQIGDTSLLYTGNIGLIMKPHTETFVRIQTQKEELVRKMEQMTVEIRENDTATVMNSYLREFKEDPPINTNECVNSYTCAEQTNLSYLYDNRVIGYLQKNLDVSNSNFIGLIVHAHCSHTPCHTCATSFARERENNGGIFSIIAGGKKVMFLCSCQEHYKRPSKMLQYKQTTFGQTLKSGQHDQEIIFDFSEGASLSPYPIVKLAYKAEENSWEEDTQFVDLIRSDLTT
jgi:hypothetical protein